MFVATARGDTTVCSKLFLKRNGLRALGDHARGKNSEKGIIFLVPEGRLGDGYMHGFHRERSGDSFTLAYRTLSHHVILRILGYTGNSIDSTAERLPLPEKAIEEAAG